jgi:hypothetical protein
MAGINRASSSYINLSESRKASGIKCVFLSHQQNDKDICRKIADYLIAADIDVYFDEYDSDLKIYRQSSNPKGVVESIKKGINKSSHMLVVISLTTIKSKWVPWEVGYGYDNSILGVLTLKGIQESDLEAYLKTATLIRGTKSLNEYISNISNSYVSSMESSRRIMDHAQTHPLDNYLDWNL